MAVNVVAAPEHTTVSNTPGPVLMLTDGATVGVAVTVALPNIRLLQPVDVLTAITV